MQQTKLIDEWWQETVQGDQDMEDDHHEFWDEVMRDVIDVDYTGKKVLDFGCNQGGMLRYIYETRKFREAVGVDVAQKSVATANARKANIPVTYLARERLDDLDRDFDYATSAAVIYLIDDIADHARQMFERLKPGGVYFISHPDYVTRPRFWIAQNEIDKFGAIKCAQNNLDDIIDALDSAGFNVHVKRVIPNGYSPRPIRAKNRWFGTATNEIEFWYNDRYAFRCVKPK